MKKNNEQSGKGKKQKKRSVMEIINDSFGKKQRVN